LSRSEHGGFGFELGEVLSTTFSLHDGEESGKESQSVYVGDVRERSGSRWHRSIG
jgi:hypothetical protein